MKSPIAASLLVLVLVAGARADGDAPPAPPAPRPAARKPVEPPKFENGKLTDTYWGIEFQLPGLEQKKGERSSGRLFEGRVGRVQVEILVWEFPDQLSAKERRDADKKKWEGKHRRMDEFAQGDDPTPWATFVGEAPSGDKRRDGWSWSTRGPRSFVVHAFAAMDAPGGADAVKSALVGLTVGPETGASVMAQMFAKQRGIPWDDPGAMDQAARQYLAEEKATGVAPLPAIAEDVARRAVAGIPGSRLESKQEAVLQLNETLATALMARAKYDEALTTLAKCADVAAKTETPGPSSQRVNYDVACCCSVAGRVDDAFAALGKAWARAADWGAPATDEDLRTDKDLENCRKDPRWAKFMATKPTKQ